MDLALLQQMREQSTQLAGKRRDTSGDAYAQGLDFLAKAHASGFEDRVALKQASEAFIKAIQYNRQSADAYVAMAYLLILMGNHPMAVRYLNEARRVAPGHADALALIDYIQHPENYASADAEDDDFDLLDLDGHDADDEVDQAYEDLEKYIRQQLRSLAAAAELQPAVTPAALQQLEVRYQELQRLSEDLDARLRDLEFEMDTAGLRSQLRPLEQALQRLQALRQVSNRLIRLCHEMETLRTEVQQQIQAAAFATDTAALESQLERFLDTCDGYADQLDDWDEDGFSIEAIEPIYARLVGTVEQLQELIDERQAA